MSVATMCLLGRNAFSNKYPNEFLDHKQDKDLEKVTECVKSCHIIVLTI